MGQRFQNLSSCPFVSPGLDSDANNGGASGLLPNISGRDLVPCFALLLRHPLPSRFSSPLCTPHPHPFSSILLLRPGLQRRVKPSGSSLMGRRGRFTRQQQLTGLVPAFCGTREAGGSDAAVGAGGGAGLVPGPSTPQTRPAGGHTVPEAAGFLTLLPPLYAGTPPLFFNPQLCITLPTHSRLSTPFVSYCQRWQVWSRGQRGGRRTGRAPPVCPPIQVTSWTSEGH